jgi:hypothetical protein
MFGNTRGDTTQGTPDLAPRPPPSGHIYAVYLPYVRFNWLDPILGMLDIVGVPNRIRTGVAAVKEA